MNLRLRFFIITLLFVLGFVNRSEAACTSPAGVAGNFDYFTAESTYKYCDGTNWVGMKYGGISSINTLTDNTPYSLTNPGRMAISGNYAYVLDSSGAVLVLDVTSIANPTPIAKLSDALLNGASNIAISGSYLVVSMSGRLVIVNVTTPSAPTVAGSVTNATLSGVTTLAVSGNYAYVATDGSSPGKLSAVDISNKAAPAIVGTLSSATIANTKGLAVSGNYAFLGGNSNALAIVDISTPTSPTITGTVTHANLNTPKAVSVSGNYAFVVSASTNGSFNIIDVTNKAAPAYYSGIVTASWGALDGANDLWINGSLAYVAVFPGNNGGGFLQTIDISNLAQPEIIFTYDVPGVGQSGLKYLAGSGTKLLGLDHKSMILSFDVSAKPTLRLQSDGYIRDKSAAYYYFVAVSGNYAAAIESDETLHIFDISNPASMVFKSQYTLPGIVNRYATGIAIKGNYVYSTNSNMSTLNVVNITDPTNPILEKTLTNSNWSGASHMAIVGNIMYLARSGGVAIFDVSDPSNPTYLSKATGASGISQRIHISGNKAYITTSSSELAIFDISNTATPTFLGKVADTTNLNGASGVAVSGNYAYVATVNTGSLTILDVSNPAAPTVVNTVINATYYGVNEDVVIVGNYAYTQSYNKGFSVSDISNPTSPVPVANIGGGGNQLFINGTTAFAATPTLIKAINITTPTAPTTIGTVTTTGRLDAVAGIAGSGNYAYSLGATGKKFTVIDISDTSAPRIVASLQDNTKFTSAANLTISGTYAYVIAPNYLTIIDISTPTSPTIVGFLNDATNLPSPKDILISGNYAFVTASNRFTVINITNKAAPTYAANATHALISDCRQMALSGSNIYMACYATNSLVAVSISTPTSPAVIGSFQDNANLLSARAIVISGNYAIVGAQNANGGGAVINISTPSSPTFVTTFGVTNIYALALKGNQLFYFSSSQNLGQMTVSDPTNPRIVASGMTSAISSSATTNFMAISGNYLLRTVSTNTVDIWNVSDTNAALYEDKRFSQTNLLGGGYRMKVVGTKAYIVAKASNRLTILDITNIDAPTILGSLADSRFDTPTGIEVSGNYAYIIGNGSGYNLAIVDVSNPANPKYLTGYSNFGYLGGGESLFISGNYLYATSRSNSRVSSFDITVPTAPVYKSNVGLTFGPYDFAVSGNYLFACGGSNIVVIDISNPLALSQSTSITDSSLTNCRTVTVDGNYLYASGSFNRTFVILDISTPTSPTIVGSLTDTTSFNNVDDIKISGNYAYIAGTSSNKISMVDISNKTSPVMAESLFSSTSVGLIEDLYVSGTRVLAPNYNLNQVTTYKATPSTNLASCSTAGSINYNTAQKALGFCDGTNYKSMGPVPGAGGSGCTSPSKAGGSLEYFTGVNKFKYCDGAAWVDVGN